MQQPQVMLIVGHDSAIGQFRRTCIAALIKRGAKVHVVVTGNVGEGAPICEALGATYEAFGISHQSRNPFSNLWLILKLARSLRAFKPNSVLVRNAQPIAFLRWAKLLSLRKCRSIALIEGLGAAQSQFVQRLWALGLSAFDRIILLNPDDKQDLVEGIAKADTNKIVLSDGIGIQLEAFPSQPMPPKGTPDRLWRVVMISRLIAEKGVSAFLEAADILKNERDFPIAFDLIGDYTEATHTDLRSQIASSQAQGNVTYHGAQSDIRPFIAKAHLHILPSTYREGLPVTVMEAAAIGRASIVTDARAVRHAVTKETGWTIASQPSHRLAANLADCIEQAIQSGDYITKGQAAEASATERFDRGQFDQMVCDLLLV